MGVEFVDATSGQSLWPAGMMVSRLVETVVEALAAQYGVPSGMTWTEYDECHVDGDILAVLTRHLVEQWDATTSVDVHRILSGVLPILIVLGERAGRPVTVGDDLAELVVAVRRDMVDPRR